MKSHFQAQGFGKDFKFYFHITEGFIAHVGKRSQYTDLIDFSYQKRSGMKLMNIEHRHWIKKTNKRILKNIKSTFHHLIN